MRLSLLALLPAVLAGSLQQWGSISTFVAQPPRTLGVKPSSVILYIPDIYGHNSTQARTLAQRISDLGNYIVVAPDIFEGEPLIEGQPFTPDWASRHGPAQVEAILDKVLAEIENRWGKVKVGGTGYCFGGRYVFRYLSAGKLAVGVSAHPSSTTIDEIVGVKGPIQIAAAAVDNSFPPTIRQQLEAAYINGTVPFSINLYGGVSHGFAVRATDPTNKQQVYALKNAAENAVAWFKAYL